MEDWVFAEPKPRMSGFARCAYDLATWPLVIGVIGAILLGIAGFADSQYGDGNLSGMLAAPLLILLLAHAFALAPLSMILGIVGLSQIGRRPQELYGREYAQVAVIVGAVVSTSLMLTLARGWLLR